MAAVDWPLHKGAPGGLIIPRRGYADTDLWRIDTEPLDDEIARFLESTLHGRAVTNDVADPVKQSSHGVRGTSWLRASAATGVRILLP